MWREGHRKFTFTVIFRHLSDPQIWMFIVGFWLSLEWTECAFWDLGVSSNPGRATYWLYNLGYVP